MLPYHTKRTPTCRACVSRSRVHSRRRMMFRSAAYSPTDGRRRTRRSPLGIEGGMNLYAFAGNGITFLIDVFGLRPISITINNNGVIPSMLSREQTEKQARAYEARTGEKAYNNQFVRIDTCLNFQREVAESCTVRQYVSDDGRAYREDVDSRNTVYGDRRVSNKADEDAALRWDGYHYYKRFPENGAIMDNQRGNSYRGVDYLQNSDALSRRNTWVQIVVMDTCNGGSQKSVFQYQIDRLK